jgi:dihydropyrimidinase
MSDTGGIYDLLVRDGTVVTPRGSTRRDVAVRDGVISALLSPGAEVEARTTIDADGRFVLPGAVDPHCHFDTFSHHADDIGSLTRAAVAGGVTTVIPFIIRGGTAGQPDTLHETLDVLIERGRRDAVIDFAYHVALSPAWDELDEIDRCAERGVSSFKMFMALPALNRMVPDDLMVAFMRRIRDCGGLGMVHAENGLVCDFLEQEQVRSGHTAPPALGRTRPRILEEEATFRAIALNEVAAGELYVVHVTCEAASRRIAEARARGFAVAGETCPQYLTLDESAMETYGALAKVAPPLRPREDCEHLWAALGSGELSSIGSDHSAHARAVKERGAENVFDGVPFGMPTVETMMPLLLSGVRREGHLSLERLVALTAENPARIFGLYPRKGAIREGADADLLVVDLEASSRVDATRHHDRGGYSVYDGWSLAGAIETVVARGEVRVSGGEVLPVARSGAFIERGSSSLFHGLS